MHPILSQTRRLALYLLAWIPLAGILQYLLAYPGGLTWPKALAMVVPLCVIYAFACLFAWYPCRSTPLETSGFSRLVLTHLAAAIVMGLFWVATAKGKTTLSVNVPLGVLLPAGAGTSADRFVTEVYQELKGGK